MSSCNGCGSLIIFIYFFIVFNFFCERVILCDLLFEFVEFFGFGSEFLTVDVGVAPEVNVTKKALSVDIFLMKIENKSSNAFRYKMPRVIP